MSKIIYYFDVRKLSDIAKPSDYVKGKFKTFFVNNAQDMFKPVNQGGLGPAKMNQLFKLPGMEDIEDAGEFINLLNNNTAFRNNALKFIKIE